MNTPRKLGLLTTLYLAQGLPFGFFTVALPVLMREQGLSLPDIGLTNLLALPWALKFLWAPLVDRFSGGRLGRRRSWILPLQGASVLAVVGLSLVDPRTGLWVMIAAVLLTNLLAATQDIATDGLAVELLHERERGLGNGIQVAGYRVGMILGGGFLVIVFHRSGWRTTFASMAAILALTTVPIALFRERDRERERAIEGTRAQAPAWLRILRRPGMGMWLLLLAVYKSGEALAYAMVKPMLVDRGMSGEDIGWLVGTAGFFAGLIGALLGGYAASRFGRRRALLGCGLLQAAAVAAYMVPASGLGGSAALAITSTLEHLIGGMATVALFTMMMDACGTAEAATEYTLQASVVVIATGVAATLSGFVARPLGYTAHFGLGAVLSLLGVAMAAWAFASGRIPPSPSTPVSSSEETAI